ncbi:MAG: 50S ribosomal protein L4 [Candidatus Omnitrophica bacterium]|nr:50S ribosomal protein L4 [Candidatus Omnitrophota bacterium]
MELYNFEGKVVGSVAVPKVLEGPVNRAVLWQAVRQYLANQREGNAETKTRGLVSGGGKKPWRQKHTGRARAGSSRSPIWRKGGVVFGPHQREYRYELPISVRRSALLNSLKAKVGDQAVSIVESLEAVAPKTKALAQFLKNAKAEGSTLVVVEKSSPILARISRNLRKVVVRPASDLTCYEVLACKRMVVTAAALKQLAAAAEGSRTTALKPEGLQG